jgi:hypothetical protein
MNAALPVSALWLAIVARLIVRALSQRGLRPRLDPVSAPSAAAAAFHFRIPFWYGLLFPLGYSAGALIALDSVRRRVRGRVSWKGRMYS